MSDTKQGEGMSVASATRLEFFIIGIGVLALVLIFQPFSLTLFAVGCALVVLAALSNNLLPLCEPGVPARSVVMAVLIVAVIFVVVVGLSLVSAYLYGRLFVGAP
jgi:predicted PurR-regulated permease PerM